MPNVQNLFFKPLSEPDYFVEPWRNRALRDCALFELADDKEARMFAQDIYSFLQDSAIIDYLSSVPETLVYGAYNQVNVCQMRAHGTVSRVSDAADIDTRKQYLESGFESAKYRQRWKSEELAERQKLLENGTLFRIRLTAYAYGMYERG